MHSIFFLIFTAAKSFSLLHCLLTDLLPNSHMDRKEVDIFCVSIRCFIAELNGSTLIQGEWGHRDGKSSPWIQHFHIYCVWGCQSAMMKHSNRRNSQFLGDFPAVVECGCIWQMRMSTFQGQRAPGETPALLKITKSFQKWNSITAA